MSFFKEFKEDLSQAVNELMPEEELEVKEEVADLELASDIADNDDDDIDLDNFDELLKAVGSADEAPKAEDVPEEITEEEIYEAEAETPQEMPVAEAEPETEAEVQQEAKEEAPVPEVKTETKKAPSDESAVITKGTSIRGDIESEGSLEIIGCVTGNVSCTGKLTITGKVKGNSKANEVFADAARVEGEVDSEGTVKIGAGSVIIGNVTATSAVIAGAINGNIDVKGPVIVDSSAVIMGDIKSRSVQINNGAVIEGFVSQCYSDIDVKSFFEENK